jgi:hypothetical protein
VKAVERAGGGTGGLGTGVAKGFSRNSACMTARGPLASPSSAACCGWSERAGHEKARPETGRGFPLNRTELMASSP